MGALCYACFSSCTYALWWSSDFALVDPLADWLNALTISIADMQIALSSNDPSTSKLYFGDTTRIYRFDGKTISAVISGESPRVWTIRDDFFYFTRSFADKSLPAGFDVKMQEVANPTAKAQQIGSVKGSLPQDLRLVVSSKPGMVCAVSIGEYVASVWPCTCRCHRLV